MKKLLAAGLLAFLSTSTLAAEPPLTLNTKVAGSVTLGQGLLIGGALLAAGIAASNSGGGSNGGTTGTTGTTGTSN